LLGHWPSSLRLALAQGVRRSPLNLRPLLGIPRTKSAYAVACFASACVYLSETGDDGDAGDRLAHVAVAAASRLDWLCASRVGRGWAYPFDVRTKTYSYAKTTANVVSTAFACWALLDGVEHLAKRAADEQLDSWRSAAVEAAAFAVETLLVGRADGSYFRYLPGHEELIHNGNVLAARFVARTSELASVPSWAEIAHDAAMTTVKAIAPDGEIAYGRGRSLDWVDGHHTGFVAEALGDLAALLEDDALTRAAETVLAYYRRSLFEPTGWPRPAPGRRLPLDVLAAAQGIQTFAKAGGEHPAFASMIAGIALEELATGSGTFMYRRGRVLRTTTQFARWSDAPMCEALAMLGLQLGRAPSDPLGQR
jgi:polysaccharide biosynthesis protein VpsJ